MIGILSNTTDWLGRLIIVLDWLIIEYFILIFPFKGKRPYVIVNQEGVAIHVDSIFKNRLALVLYSGGQNGYVPLRSAIYYLELERLSWSEINRIIIVRKHLMYHVRVTSVGRNGRVVYAAYKKKKALEIQRQLKGMRKAYKAGYTYPIGTRINVFSQYNFGDSNNSGVENLKQNSLT